MLISDFSIRHRTTIVILSILIVVAGLIAYATLPRESAPDIKIPNIMILTSYEGASPSDIESLITRPVERKMKSLTEIKEMRSTSSEGLSTILIEFEPDFDLDTALQKVRDKVDQAKPDLPDDLLNDPVIKEISASDIFPVMFVNISGDVGLARLKKIAEDLEEDIEAVRGVLEANILGGVEREIRLEFDQDRIAGYGLTMGEIIQAVSRNNVTTPGGSLDIGDAKYSLKAPAEFTRPEEIFYLVVAVRDGKPIYLSDIAAVRDTYKDRDSFSRLDGRESVAIRVTKRPGENLLKIAEQIKAILGDYRRRLPPQIRLSVTSDSSEDIRRMVAELNNNLLSGLVLVLGVIFVSMGLRNAALVAIAVPFSMLITFSVVQWCGMTLNMIVLFSLILSLGMLVDNAIVIVENIYRHHVAERKPLARAAMEATQEVAWPVISSTLTTVVAFVPLLFWPGVMGEFMSYLPKTVIIALLASLFVAMVINPTFGAMFIKKSWRDRADVEGSERFGPIIRSYRAFLAFGLRYRMLSVLFFFGVLAVMVYAFAHSGLGVEMFPDTEPQRITAAIEAPEGTNVERANKFALQAEQIIFKYGNIEHITTAVGQGSGQESGPHTARIMIDMIDREQRRVQGDGGKIYFRNSNDTMAAIRAELAQAIVGAEVKVDKQEMGPPVGAPINIEIAGDDYAVLARLAETLKDKTRDLPGVVDLTDDYMAGLPEIKIDIDKERAALLGLDAFLIGQVVKAAVNGIKIGDYREGEDEYDIVARLPESQRQTLEDILRLRIPDQRGRQVPLTSVAKVVTTSGLSAIKHIDQKRVVTVSANVAKGFNAQQALAQARAIAETIPLQPGYSFRYTGQNEEMEESKAFMFKAFVIGVLLIVLVLVTQFDSILTPLIIMATVPLSLIGVFLGLIVARQPFGVIMTGMGVISLAGVVVNNAIVLLAYTNQLRQRGLSCYDAIIRAGCTRFRPVTLTAVTAVLGLIPTAVGVSYNFVEWKWDIGAESVQWWGPMATAVTFGLVVATMLTLFVVPNLYSLFFDWGLHSRRKAAGEAADRAPKAGELESAREAPSEPVPAA